MRTTFFAVLLLFAIVLPASASVYYLSPTGNDANSGLTASTPWLTPKHALNCGDVILAAASTAYSHANFSLGQWGPVTCAGANNVAWLKCVTFDACKITVPSGVHDFGMAVTASYWGVQGWEVNNFYTGQDGLTCFTAMPANTASPSIHHIIFANNVASTCANGGIAMGNVAGGITSVDYFAAVGNVVYNAGTSNAQCGSGIGVLTPVASDTTPGTHIYVAGNFVYATVNPPGCYDANGISFDTLDGGGATPVSYDQQAVMDNNISIGNQGVGTRVQYNNAGSGPTHSHVYVSRNTMWGNSSGFNQYGSPDCGEYQMFRTVTTYVYLNLAATNQPGCYDDAANPHAAYTVKSVDSTSYVLLNWGYSATGTNTQSISSPTFTFGPANVLGVDPRFTHPTVPGAPSCGGAANVPSCMAALIMDFKPTTPGAAAYGYQTPSLSPVYDPLFPQWLCNVNLPSGLVSMGCVTPQNLGSLFR